jgi:hypothetical protein
LTTLFGSTAVIAIAAPKKKRSLLPLLTVLFLFSYGLMTMLIVEQGSVIQSQRNLIQTLMLDSHELWGMKGKAVANAAQNQAKGRSNQDPSTQAPSTQAAPQQHAQSRAGRTAKPGTQPPPMPASDLVDQRRVLRTI